MFAVYVHVSEHGGFHKWYSILVEVTTVFTAVQIFIKEKALGISP